MKNKKLEILIIAFISMKLFIFQWDPVPTFIVTGQNSQRTFGLNNYSNNIGNNDNGNVLIYGHKLFVNTGDANFYMADITTSNSNVIPNTSQIFTHNFGNGNFNSYAELTGIYKDKDDPPKRISASPSVEITGVTPTQSAQLSTVALNPISGMKFTPVRKVVPNDMFSMILSIQQDRFNQFDNLIVQYDNTAFSLEAVASGTKPYYKLSDIGNGQIAISKTPFNDNRTYPYHITLSFKTNPLPIGDVVGEFKAICKYIDNKPAQTEIFSDPNALTVVNSHDPNNKNFIPNYFSDTDGNIKVLINFQNEGNGPTTNVFIEDELDPALLGNMNASDIIGIQGSLSLISPNAQNVIPDFRFQDGKIKVELCGLRLRGKKEKAVDGSYYPESETMGSLSYSIPKRLLTKIQTCHSVANSAQIFFDCNPPISTDLAYLTRIEPDVVKSWLEDMVDSTKKKTIYPRDETSEKDKVKLAPWVDVKSICPRPEVFCKDVIKSKIDLENFNKASSICGLNIDGTASFRWYPASILTNPFARNLNFEAGNRRLKQNFALLVSQNAQETIVHVPVDMCNMSLSYTWKNGAYQVQVDDANMQPSDELVWNVDCTSCNGQRLRQQGARESRNGRVYTITNPLQDDPRLITVYNPNTGCSAQVELPYHNERVGMSWWRWAQILMGVFLLVFLIWASTGKKRKKNLEK